MSFFKFFHIKGFGSGNDAEVTSNQELKVKDSGIGEPTDVVAPNDTADVPLISLFKRLLQKVTSFVTGLVRLRSTHKNDPGNSAVRTSANGATPFTGASFDCRNPDDLTERVVAAQQLIFASNVVSGLGGTFIFEYSNDNFVTTTVSETRTIGDFATVRDLTLQNVGDFFRIGSFTPSRALVGGEFLAITTDQWFITPPEFVRLANQEIEEQNAAMGQTFSYNKAFVATTGKSVNVRASAVGDLLVDNTRLTTSQSGSLFVEGIRDDIAMKFSRNTGATEITTLVNNGSINGTVTHNSTEGQAVFAVPATAGSTCYYESSKTTQYEPGHMIRGGQTIQISAQPTGNGKIEWGFGEDNGAGGLLNGIGYGYDSLGLYTFRLKGGVYASKVYQIDFNRDKLAGALSSRYIFNDAPAIFNPLNNSIYEYEFEWYGIAPPTYLVMSPQGAPIETHVEETTGKQTGTTIPEPNLPMFIRVQNDTVSGQVLSVMTGSWRGGILTNKTAVVGKNPSGVYADVNTDEFGNLQVTPEKVTTVEPFESITGFTALNSDTTGIALSNSHIRGTKSVTFNKVDGAANTVFAVIQKTITAIDLSQQSVNGLISVSCYLSDTTNVNYALVRLGTDSSNYNEWRIPVSSLISGDWTLITDMLLGTPSFAGSTGNGWNSAAITYIAVGIAFNAQNNTLSGIIFDNLEVFTTQHTSTSSSNTTISSANINVQKIGGNNTASNIGVANNGTQRVVLASDQPNVAVTDANLKNKIGASSSLTNVAASASSVTLSASNVNLISRNIYNDSASVMYLKYGSSASATSFTQKLFPDESWTIDEYNGIVTAVWVTATGSARITEITL